MNGITSIVEPVALGFSTGTWCVMYCAPVLLPFLFGREGLTHRKNASLIGLFLAGRLASYIGVGLALGAAGLLVTEFFDPVLARHLSVIAYIFCGAVLLANALVPGYLAAKNCCGSGTEGVVAVARPRCASTLSALSGDRMTALLSGLCVGLHICPPFWAAAVRSAAAGSPAAGAAYFGLFYAGTLPFFLPLLGIPFFITKLPYFRKIARITQILVGGYFFLFAGIVPFVFRG